MGTADAFARLAAVEVGVVLAPDELPGVQVHGVAVHLRVQVAEGQQGRDVGVVHELVGTETIDLIGVDGTIDRMLDHGVGVQGLVHLGGEGDAFRGHVRLVVHGGEDLRHLLQRRDGHKVGGDEEFEGRGVVGGTEGRCDEAHRLHRVAPAHHALGVQLAVGLTEEPVTAVAPLPLLLLEGGEDGLRRLHPQVAEDGGVAGLLPVGIGEAHRIAVRVDLPLALEHVRAGSGEVRLVGRAHGIHVERVGVRVDEDALELAVDDAR